MCTPNATFGFNLASTALQTVGGIVGEKKNLKYKTQIALNNAKAANNEALRQKQLGLEEARKEKIEGMKNASTLMAKNASNGFDMNSNTNLLSYKDTINSANSNAQNIQKDYDYKADSYFDKARDYLGDIKQYQNEYNASVYDKALWGLGNTQKVTEKWFSDNKKGRA